MNLKRSPEVSGPSRLWPATLPIMLSITIGLLACEEPSGAVSDDPPDGGCAAACEPGARRCSPETGAVEACALIDGCPGWELSEGCPAGTACAAGACAPVCQGCGVGERACSGGGVRVCDAMDAQGCPAFGEPTPCEAGMRCDNGGCVPADRPCEDACAASGETTCTEGGYVRCGQFDEDDCLDLSPSIPCGSGQICREGECVPDCNDECAVNELRCREDAVVQCGNFDHDLCLEFSAPTPCGEGARCDNGRCVPRAQACVDECEGAGEMICDEGGEATRVCGQYDADECLELSSPVPCAAGQACREGACVNTCEDQCAEGAVRCEGGGEQFCDNFDRDPCLEWSPASPCDEDEQCDDGRCVEVVGPCEDACEAVGLRACQGDGVAQCADVDDDPCLEWTPALPCAEDQRCEGGACVSDCQDECAAGEATCEGGGLRACGNHDGDPCLELSPPSACPEGQTCSGGQCRVDCVDDCQAEGQQACADDGASFRVCGAYDADPCLDWSSPFFCGAQEACEGGACVAVCQDQCAEGERRCLVDGYETCADFDDDDCLEFGGGASCGEGQLCEEGFCSATCDDACAEGEARCGDDGGVELCGNFDADACLEWSSADPCAPHEACEGGACVAQSAPHVVLISELLYNSAGSPDTDAFVEVYGPAGASLRGFTLMGVNGNGGREYNSIVLDGEIGDDGLFVVAHPQAQPFILDEADQLSMAVDYQNGPDSLQIRFGDEIIDALAYGDFGPDVVMAGEAEAASSVEPDYSLGRDAEWRDTDNNAADFTSFSQPTPGAPNVGVNCAPQDHQGCHLDEVWWFDACGNPTERVVGCPYGCLNGQCQQCTPACDGRTCGGDGCGGDCGACDGEQLCIDDNCVDVLCEPGQRRCDGPTPERCNDNGTAWEPDSDCASGCLYGDCLAGALSGDVSGELCGAYVITADLQVPQGFSVSLCAGSLLHLGSSTLRVAGTLEVAEGVTVYAEAGSAIQVSGTLTVLGDAQAEVVMRPPPESPDARHGGVDVEASGVVNLEHMVIEGSALGLDVALGGTATGSDLRFVDTATGVRSRSASVQLTRLDFSNNTTCADLSAGILEDSVLGSCSSVGAQLSGEATLTHSNISTTGEGVRVTGGAPSIEHNNIRDNHGNGIVVLDGEPAIHHNNVHGNARQASRWYARASFSCSVGYREDPFFESQTFTAPGDSGVTEVTTELRYGSYCSARGTVGGGELWSSACHSCPGISDPYCRDEGARTFPPQGTLSVGLACSTHCLSDYNNRCRSSFTVQAVRLSGGSLIEIYSQSANDIDATDNYFGVALPGDVPERVFNKSGSTITSPYAAAPVVGAGPR